MQDKIVNIEQMTLRIPGVNEKEGHDIGREVVQRVADQLPASYQARRLNALDLKLTVSTGTSRSEMTKLITEAILIGLV
jgi:hypothetical protein